MLISQFFVLSARGDVIIRRDFLGNVPKQSPEIFFRLCKFWTDGEEQIQGEAPPVFANDGITYLHTKEGGLQFLATTRDNVSPSFVLEFLRRMCVIIKDYCGSLTEVRADLECNCHACMGACSAPCEGWGPAMRPCTHSQDAVRKNFTLIYELLDEVMDYGMPINTSTEAIKTFVLNEPVVVPPGGSAAAGLVARGLAAVSFNKGPTGVFKSVLDTSRTDGKRRDEIFVDVVERVSCTFNASGYIVSSQVDGAVQIKSYLAGNPQIKIKLNDDLIIGKRDSPYGARHADAGASERGRLGER